MNKKNNILLITTSFPITKDSQSGIFVKNLVDHLSNNISVEVITPANNEFSGTNKLSETVTFHAFNYLPGYLQLLAHKPGGIPVALKNNKFLYFTIPPMLIAMFFKTLLLSRNSQAIHANWTITAVIAGIVSKMRKIPLITTLRGEDITRANNSMLYKLLLNLTLYFSSHIVTVSESIKNQLQSNYSHRNIHFIPNGVSSLFSKSYINRTYNKKNVYKIISVGSLIPRKGYDQTINAIGKLKEFNNISFIIIGDGSEKDKLLSLIKQKGLTDKIEFIGSCDQPTIVNHLKESDIFILSSHSEGRPNVILEAMACGLPIIATDISGNNELIKDLDNGLLFEDGDIETLTQSINKLLSSSETREKIGRSAHKYIIENNLTWSACAENYHKLYKY
jgi:glycosyltransferase involved in cell wall biosynthesis